jgi:hypothetical protein
MVSKSIEANIIVKVGFVGFEGRFEAGGIVTPDFAPVAGYSKSKL